MKTDFYSVGDVVDASAERSPETDQKAREALKPAGSAREAVEAQYERQGLVKVIAYDKYGHKISYWMNKKHMKQD